MPRWTSLSSSSRLSGSSTPQIQEEPETEKHNETPIGVSLCPKVTFFTDDVAASPDVYQQQFAVSTGWPCRRAAVVVGGPDVQ
jgi:hypothetical protein